MLQDPVYLEDIMYERFTRGELSPLEYIRWLHNTSEKDKKQVISCSK
jgi:hypothetical protein